jgi:hypothetical protein
VYLANESPNSNGNAELIDDYEKIICSKLKPEDSCLHINMEPDTLCRIFLLDPAPDCIEGLDRLTQFDLESFPEINEGFSSSGREEIEIRWVTSGEVQKEMGIKKLNLTITFEQFAEIRKYKNRIRIAYNALEKNGSESDHQCTENSWSDFYDCALKELRKSLETKSKSLISFLQKYQNLETMSEIICEGCDAKTKAEELKNLTEYFTNKKRAFSKLMELEPPQIENDDPI